MILTKIRRSYRVDDYTERKEKEALHNTVKESGNKRLLRRQDVLALAREKLQDVIYGLETSKINK